MATPVANSVSAMAQVVRLSLWTMAMATGCRALKRKAGPVDPAHGRPAGDDALAARVERLLEVRDDLDFANF